MARTSKKQETKPLQTRAEKRDGAKNLIREILAKGSKKASELIEEAAGVYTDRFGGEDTENPNDVKGRIGSVLDVMKKDGDVAFEGGMYAMKVEQPQQETLQETAEKPAKKTPRTRVKKTETKAVAEVKAAEEPLAVETEEKPKKKAASKKKTPLPAPPLQPIAPVVPDVVPNDETAPIEEKQEEQTPPPTPKKRGRKAKEQPKEQETLQEKPTEKAVETPIVQAEEKQDEQRNETALVTKPKAELSPKGTVMDMSFLFGGVKNGATPKKMEPTENLEKAESSREIKADEKPLASAALAQKTQKKPQERKTVEQPEQVGQSRVSVRSQVNNKTVKIVKAVKKPLTADEKLQAAFLTRLHRLSGDYFEYFSVYLLEKYSRQNGRRLESLRITAGDHDGGIDGELELTDKLGFRETIYIQAKNWDPDKGTERLWVVGETLLQQFLGACACRQAKDGKQNCRGIFITTSRFTPEAKRLLNVMSDKIVGYDGTDLYEAAKECGFGIVKKNGEWALDEQLLSGEKAFFNML